MRPVRMSISIRLVSLLLVGAMPAATIAAESPHPIDKAWVRTHRAAADAMIAKLDMTSFPNSIGPSRSAGKTTLANYGFTQRSIFDDGWAYAKTADGSWQFGVFVLTDGTRAKTLCITDSALGGGTYHATTAIEATPGPGGLWRSARVLHGVRGCA